MAPVTLNKEPEKQEKRKKVRVRGSKHKKRNWRDSNIKDVEDFLDEKRRDERIRSRAQRTDDELVKIKRKISARGKLTSNDKIDLPKFACLDVDPDPFPKPSVDKKPKRLTRNPIQKAKFKLAESKLAKPKLSAKNQYLSLFRPNKDIWVDEKETFENEYLEEANEYFKQQTRQKQIKPPTSLLTKPSTLPAVEVPDPGASYNPVYEDHQKLLQKAREIEIKKKKEEMHLHRVLTQKFPAPKDAPTEATWLQEMSQGINQKDEEKSESENEEFISYNPPTLNNKKTKAKRNKEMRQKLIEKKLRKEKSERKRENEVFKIKSILSGVKKKEKFVKQRAARRLKRQIEKMAKPARLGRVKYEDLEVEVTLSTELQGSLREMKPMGSLLEDRMKSLQRRNIIEPLVRQKNKRKYKLKKFVKKSHKDSEIPTVK